MSSVQGFADDNSKSLSINGLYDRYDGDADIRIYFRTSDMKTIKGDGYDFTIAKPIAVRVGDYIDDGDLNYTFTLKSHMVKSIASLDYQYWALSIQSKTESFNDKDGVEHQYHPAKVMCVCNPKAIKQLTEYAMAADGVSKYNGDHI